MACLRTHEATYPHPPLASSAVSFVGFVNEDATSQRALIMTQRMHVRTVALRVSVSLSVHVIPGSSVYQTRVR